MEIHTQTAGEANIIGEREAEREIIIDNDIHNL